jgi:acyl-CoA thioesterase
MHAYFLRPGTPGQPIRYEVDRIRDGRSFTTRRVVGWQDQPIFTTALSFHGDEPGPDYQQPMPLRVPSPDETPDNLGFIPVEARDTIPMEFKELGPTPVDEQGFHASTRRVWMRIRRQLPDDPDLHAAMIAFLSDMGAVMGARAPLDEQPLDRLMGASLDHSLWFHRPLRADEWFLYDLGPARSGSPKARGTTRFARLRQAKHTTATLVASPIGSAPSGRYRTQTLADWRWAPCTPATARSGSRSPRKPCSGCSTPPGPRRASLPTPSNDRPSDPEPVPRVGRVTARG